MRCLAGIAAVILGSSHPLVAALRDGESDPMRFTEAYQILEQQVPALTRRHILATYAAVTWPPKPKEPKQ
jgi:hypothetical protein